MYSTECDLVLHIIEYYHGQLVSKISGYILLQGPITLNKLVNCTPYNFRLIRNVLLILIRHQIVDYKLESIVDDHEYVNILYSISTIKVLSLLLIPFGLLRCQNLLDENSLNVLTLISKYGTISTRRIKKYFNTTPTHIIDDSIFKLVNQQLISTMESYNTQKTKYKDAIYDYDPVDVLENLRNEKFTLFNGQSFESTDHQLFYININHIIDNLLKEEVEQLICKRLGDNSLVRTILKVLMKGPMPRYLSFNSIDNEVQSLNDNNSNIPSDNILRILNGLTKHPDNLVSYEDGHYYLNWYNAKKMLKEKAIFGAIKQLCGIKAVRLWNLIINETEKNSNMLDIHQISEKGLVSIQTARSIMYQLTLKGFTKLYESDANNNNNINQTDRQTLYFTTSLDSSYLQVMKLSYKFASNILERLVHERGINFQRIFINIIYIIGILQWTIRHRQI